MISLYNKEFLSNLMVQATNCKEKYKPVNHKCLVAGDLVLLKEPLMKPVNYPMAIVRETVFNDLQEVTSVLVYKGATKELVKRHVTSIIPLLMHDEYFSKSENSNVISQVDTVPVAANTRTKRAAALRSRDLTNQMISNDLT